MDLAGGHMRKVIYQLLQRYQDDLVYGRETTENRDRHLWELSALGLFCCEPKASKNTNVYLVLIYSLWVEIFYCMCMCAPRLCLLLVVSRREKISWNWMELAGVVSCHQPWVPYKCSPCSSVLEGAVSTAPEVYI